MKRVSRVLAIVTAGAVLTGGGALLAQPTSKSYNLEPNAGKWKTWFNPAQSYQVPPPPDTDTTRAELDLLNKTVAELGPEALDRIRFWDAGAPVYRWMNMMEKRIAAGETITAHPHRVLAYLAMAMYDATVVAWNAKYTYKRSRPSDFDPRLNPVVAVPDSPSYPSEHAVVSAAAAGVLSYFFPTQADAYQKLAAEAAASRVSAGVQYPSDASAGLELGRQVAQNVIQQIANDGYTLVWTGGVPAGRCFWTGSNPGGATAPNWKPILLRPASEFRPAPPPDCESAQMKAEAALVRNFARTFNTNQKAYYWQSAEGRETWAYILAERWMFEDKTDRNPPRAARVYALLAAALYDAYIASQDGKFTYWYLRPHQLDPGITPLFAVPNFPSYPSNHAVTSFTRAEVLAYLFPTHADEAGAVGKEASDSRIWAGIHYPVDVEAGKALGQAVAQRFIAWAQQDGSR